MSKLAPTLELAGIRRVSCVAIELGERSVVEIVDMFCDLSKTPKTHAEAVRVFATEAAPRLRATAAAKVVRDVVTISAYDLHRSWARLG